MKHRSILFLCMKQNLENDADTEDHYNISSWLSYSSQRVIGLVNIWTYCSGKTTDNLPKCKCCFCVMFSYYYNCFILISKITCCLVTLFTSCLNWNRRWSRNACDLIAYQIFVAYSVGSFEVCKYNGEYIGCCEWTATFLLLKCQLSIIIHLMEGKLNKLLPATASRLYSAIFILLLSFL